MNRRSLLALLICTLLANAKSHTLAWQKGDVAAIEVLRIPINTKKMRYRYTYTLHGAGHTYTFDDRAKLNLTVNGPVEYAVEGDRIFVRDEAGKEHKETILQKAVDKADQ